MANDTAALASTDILEGEKSTRSLDRPVPFCHRCSREQSWKLIVIIIRFCLQKSKKRTKKLAKISIPTIHWIELFCPHFAQQAETFTFNILEDPLPICLLRQKRERFNIKIAYKGLGINPR